ncbi:hypothetical protein CBR_g36892 [Chara braunii]|uniref:Uncharacterized protein n=1 Tax=Chara braunii TaxID=69332 RepID=A0A388LLV0_CHABU|nr:hypothetical protein CBR_g36892 [Chara braunii]|eukprot:GBG83277.1 hypothetical protein CBR_g36892 [Chara braunii]
MQAGRSAPGSPASRQLLAGAHWRFSRVDARTLSSKISRDIQDRLVMLYGGTERRLYEDGGINTSGKFGGSQSGMYADDGMSRYRASRSGIYMNNDMSRYGEYRASQSGMYMNYNGMSKYGTYGASQSGSYGSGAMNYSPWNFPTTFYGGTRGPNLQNQGPYIGYAETGATTMTDGDETVWLGASTIPPFSHAPGMQERFPGIPSPMALDGGYFEESYSIPGLGVYVVPEKPYSVQTYSGLRGAGRVGPPEWPGYFFDYRYDMSYRDRGVRYRNVLASFFQAPPGYYPGYPIAKLSLRGAAGSVPYQQQYFPRRPGGYYPGTVGMGGIYRPFDYNAGPYGFQSFQHQRSQGRPCTNYYDCNLTGDLYDYGTSGRVSNPKI